MKKTIIHYFTATGNTLHAVNIIKDRLLKKGYKVKLQKSEKKIIPDNEKYDFHIFAFSIFGFSASHLMKKYIKKMPKGNGEKVALLAVCGGLFHKNKIIPGWPGQALEQVESILKRKNYDVFLSDFISYPENWTQVVNPPDKKGCEIIMNDAKKTLEEFINKFLKNQKKLYRCGMFLRIVSSVLSFFFVSFARRILGKCYISDENCNSCGLCIKTCPSGTIVMFNKKPRWKSTCEGCNRCINICPEKAIQFSLVYLIINYIMHIGLLIFIILGFIYFIKKFILIGNILFLLGLEISAIILISSFFVWFQLILFDAFILLLEQIPVVRKFFLLGFTKKFRRYLAPGFNPNKN